MNHLLIVDDERGSRESLKAVFSDTFRCSVADRADEAAAVLDREAVDLMLLDVMMPDRDGVRFLQDVRARHPDLPVIMVSAAQSVRHVVDAIQAGAVDYVTKPWDIEEMRSMVHRALESSRLRRRVEILQSEMARQFPVHGIVGEAPSFSRALLDARKAAETDATVLIQGESGTGKELLARLVHTLSARREEPFVAVHCAALPETLMESELFGHEKGAFTGADRRRQGRFEMASSGTLFFDEVAEMPAATQVKLLRVLQEKEFTRIGGSQVIPTNARIVAASAKTLKEEVAAGRFRDDLFYRLHVVPIHLPPLRDRRPDIPLLANHFLEYFRASMNVGTRRFAPDAMDRLLAYAWPGNVRELRNIIERTLVLHGREEELTLAHLPTDLRESPEAAAAPAVPGAPPADGTPRLAEAVDAFERQLVTRALEEAGGVQTRAAERLGTTRRILKYRMEKLGISVNGGARGA